MKFTIDPGIGKPVYKQLMEQIRGAAASGKLAGGEVLPSMNELARQLDISKETVKKAYSLLREQGVVYSTQGKGFFLADGPASARPRILILFDKFSSSKQVIYNAFASEIGGKAEVMIQFHHQNVDLMKYFLDENLSAFDYFVVTPHFPLDGTSQKKALKQLRRIPARKLILLDRDVEGLPGRYGTVFQDFRNDSYDGLLQGLDKLRTVSRLNVIREISSLYYDQVMQGVTRFCSDFGLEMSIVDRINPDIIREKEVYLVLNGQIETALVELTHAARKRGLQPGSDISIISYNDAPINDIILGGLTTISTDFAQMGRTGAEMILDKDFRKIHNPFSMTRRFTF